MRDRRSRTNLEATHILIGLRQYIILGVDYKENKGVDYKENKEDLVGAIEEVSVLFERV